MAQGISGRARKANGEHAESETPEIKPQKIFPLAPHCSRLIGTDITAQPQYPQLKSWDCDQIHGLPPSPG